MLRQKVKNAPFCLAAHPRQAYNSLSAPGVGLRNLA